MDGTASIDQVGPVELTLPASSEHLRLSRLVATSLAATLGLDVDQLDDLRIAVDELCSLLVEHALDGASLRLRLQGQPKHLEVEGFVINGGPGPALDAISRQILDGLDVTWGADQQAASFRIVAPREAS